MTINSITSNLAPIEYHDSSARKFADVVADSTKLTTNSVINNNQNFLEDKKDETTPTGLVSSMAVGAARGVFGGPVGIVAGAVVGAVGYAAMNYLFSDD